MTKITQNMRNKYQVLLFLFLQTILILNWSTNTLGHRHKNGNGHGHGDGVQPLSQINILSTKFAIHNKASVRVSTILLPTEVMYCCISNSCNLWAR